MEEVSLHIFSPAFALRLNHHPVWFVPRKRTTPKSGLRFREPLTGIVVRVVANDTVSLLSLPFDAEADGCAEARERSSPSPGVGTAPTIARTFSCYGNSEARSSSLWSSDLC